MDLLAACHTFPAHGPHAGLPSSAACCMGWSLGWCFLQGATTGGTDLIARLLKLPLAWLPMGKLLLAVDLVVIAAGGRGLPQHEQRPVRPGRPVYLLLVMDRVLYGLDNAKVAYIISDRPPR